MNAAMQLITCNVEIFTLVVLLGVKTNMMVSVFPARKITVKQKPQCHLAPAVSILPLLTCLNVCTLKELRNIVCVIQITQLTWAPLPGTEQPSREAVPKVSHLWKIGQPQVSVGHQVDKHPYMRDPKGSQSMHSG